MHSRAILNTVAIATMAILSFGCGHVGPMPVAVMYGDVDPGEWNEMWPLQLNLPGDTVRTLWKGTYAQATIWVRYNLTSGRDVTMVVSYESLNQEEECDTLTFTLYNPEGKPDGEGAYGIYEAGIPLKKPVRLDDGLVFRIWPAGEARGISGAGVAFYPPEETKTGKILKIKDYETHK